MTSFADPGSQQMTGDDSRDVQVNLNADVSGYTQQVGAAQQATMGLAGSVDKLSGSLDKLTKFAGRQLFHFSAAGFAGLSGAVADAASLEHQLGTLRATSVITGTSMTTMSKELDKAFTSLPVARRELVALTETVTNLGVTKPKEAVGAAVTYTKMGAATGEDPTALATGSLQLNRMMGNTQGFQRDNYANSVVELSKNNGVAATSILEFSQAIAPMARAAGIGQAAVEGIATAFTKAGADGGYAANTFNKIVTEIETLKETGSPEIGKYASFVGKSTEEFRGQNATTSATQLFKEIGKGGPEGLNFMASLGLGPRDLKAIQSVAQTGGLGSNIAEARKGVTNTDALDAGAKAAFSGLTNSMSLLGNQFTKLGEIIGAPFLDPLTKVAKGLGFIAEQVNKVLTLMGPLPGYAMALVSALALPAGLALAHFGVTSALALGGAVNKGATVTAYKEAKVAGQAIRGGAQSNLAMGAGPAGTRFMAGQMGPLERLAYNTGLNRGAAGPGLGSTLVGGARRGFGGTLGAATWLTNQMGFSKPGTTPPTLRQSMQTGSAMGLARAGVGAITSTVRMGAQAAASLTGTAAQMVGSKAIGFMSPAMARMASGAAGAVAPVAAAGAGLISRGVGALFSPMGMLATMVGVPLVSGMISAIKEGNAKRADMSTALTGSSVYDQTLDRVSTNLARFGESLDAASDRLKKFADLPVEGMGTVTPEDISTVQGKDYKVDDQKLTAIVRAAEKSKDPKAFDKAIGAYLDAQAIEIGGPLKSDALTKYRQDILSLHGANNADDVSRVMTNFITRQGTNKVVTPDFGATGALAGTTTEMGTLDKKDKYGIKASEANFDDFKDILGSGVSALNAGTKEAGIGGLRTELTGILSMGGKGTSGPTAGQADRLLAFNKLLETAFKIDPQEMLEAQKKAGEELGTTQAPTFEERVVNGHKVREMTSFGQPYGNEADANRVNARALASLPKGKELLKLLGWTETDLLAGTQHPGELPQPEASGTVTSLRQKGPLGQWAAGNEAFVAAAVGKDSGKPGPENVAAMSLAAEATRRYGGDLVKATSAVGALAGAMSGANSTTGALIGQSEAWMRTLENYRLPTLSRAQQFSEISRTSMADQIAGNAEGATAAQQAQGGASRLKRMDAKESGRQWAIDAIKNVVAYNTQYERAAEANTIQVNRSKRDFTTQQRYAKEDTTRSRGYEVADYKTSKSRAEQAQGLAVKHSQEDYTTSSLRADEDYHTQLKHSQEDYATSQLRALQDYYKSAGRAQEDYQLQSARAQEDYQTSTSRQTADHLKDLKRQGEAAAQTIYDPFARIQVKATTDAGTLIYNLKEQNDQIAKQMAEIEELKAKGISQQTIDTLKLGDAENAQQVSALDQSLTQNPGMAKQINAQISTRVTDTKKLTQDPSNNVAFRQGEEDFAQSMTRGSEDFSKTQKRAAADHSTTMRHMSEDFGTTTAHAAEDQEKSLRRMSDAYAVQTDRAATDQEKSLNRMSEAFGIQQDAAAADQEKTLQRMDDAAVLTSRRAVDAQALALRDMMEGYKLAQKYAAADLANSLIEYTGSFETLLGQLAELALGKLKTYGPAASAIYVQAVKDMRAAMPTPLDLLTGANPDTPPNPGTQGPNYGIPQGPSLGPNPPANQPSPYSTLTGAPTVPAPNVGHSGPNYGIPQGSHPFAFGGISLTQQHALVSEHGPELHLPLNSRGENFLAGLIAKSLSHGVTTAVSGGPATASTTNDNSISFAGAEIQVVSQDPNQMARELAAKAKLARLASPVRH